MTGLAGAVTVWCVPGCATVVVWLCSPDGAAGVGVETDGVDADGVTPAGV